MRTLIASLVKGEKRKMSIKLKPSQTIRDKKTGKLTTEHYYIKNINDLELIKIVNNESTKAKVRQKVKNEIARRKKL